MSNQIIKSAVMIVTLTMIGRLLGFLRNILLTNEFGVGVETDAFNMAYTIPLALFLIVPGAVNAVFIPAMKGLPGDLHALQRNQLFHKSLTFVLLLFACISAAGMIWSGEVISWLAHGFTAAQQSLTAEMLRIMMPSALFIGLIAIISSVLNAHHTFFATTMGPVINGTIVIASLYILAPTLGIQGIAWGTTIGFAVYAGYLLFPLRRFTYSVRVNLHWRQDRLFHGMGERFVPIMIGMVVSQCYLFIEKMMASGLGDAKVTTLVLANGLVQLPVAIFAGALAVPIFPLLSEYVKRNQMGEMKELLGKGFLYQFHTLLPATMGLILLAPEFVSAFYDHSETFTAQDVQMTAWALVFYSIGMVGWAGRDLLTRASYAIENTKNPVISGAISLVVYVGLAWLLIPWLDHGGLALAFSAATYFNMLLQAWFLRREIGTLFPPAFYISLGKGVMAVAVMTIVLWLLREPAMTLGLLGLLGLVVTAVVVYYGSLWLSKEVIVKDLVGQIARRIHK